MSSPTQQDSVRCSDVVTLKCLLLGKILLHSIFQPLADLTLFVFTFSRKTQHNYVKIMWDEDLRSGTRTGAWISGLGSQVRHTRHNEKIANKLAGSVENSHGSATDSICSPAACSPYSSIHSAASSWWSSKHNRQSIVYTGGMSRTSFVAKETIRCIQMVHFETICAHSPVVWWMR